jgi:hypothetical protein
MPWRTLDYGAIRTISRSGFVYTSTAGCAPFPGIGQLAFDDAEDGGAVSTALVFSHGLAQSGQGGSQCAQVSEGVVDVADALLEQCGDPVAGGGAVALQIQDVFDFPG